MTFRRFQSLEEVPAGRRVVALGTFDGVHLGHRRVVSAAVEEAQTLGVPTLGAGGGVAGNRVTNATTALSQSALRPRFCSTHVRPPTVATAVLDPEPVIATGAPSTRSRLRRLVPARS